MFTSAIMLETLMTTLLKSSETGNGERFAVGLDMTRQPLQGRARWSGLCFAVGGVEDGLACEATLLLHRLATRMPPSRPHRKKYQTTT